MSKCGEQKQILNYRESWAHITSMATRKELLKPFLSAQFSKMLNELLEKEHKIIRKKQCHCINPCYTHSLSVARRYRNIEEIKKDRLIKDIKDMEQLLLCGATQTGIPQVWGKQRVKTTVCSYQCYEEGKYRIVSQYCSQAHEWGPCN